MSQGWQQQRLRELDALINGNLEWARSNQDAPLAETVTEYIHTLVQERATLLDARAAAAAAAAAAPAPRLTGAVVLAAPYADIRVSAGGRSMHSRAYGPGLQLVSWPLSDAAKAAICEYVAAKVEGVVLDSDPRYDPGPDHHKQFTSEDELNHQFGVSVGRVVQAVLCKLGLNIEFHVSPRTDVVTGKPDFEIWADGQAVTGGEGKTPHVMACMGDVLNQQARQDPIIRSCLEQTCCYLRDKGWRCGFLSWYLGTVFVERLSADTYSLTAAFLPTDTFPSAATMLTYIILKLLDEPRLVTPAPQRMLTALVEESGPSLQQQQAAGPQQQQQQQRQSPRLSAGPSAAAGASGRFGAPLSTTYAVHPPEALLLTENVLGHGESGPVREAWFSGARVAVKFADVYKQPELLQHQQMEVDMYGRLSELQGTSIPHLRGHGFYKDDALFFVATSVIDGQHIGVRSPLRVRAAAEQALHTIHKAGVAHGDVRADNIIVQMKGEEEVCAAVSVPTMCL